jgi:hypothetical protein
MIPTGKFAPVTDAAPRPAGSFGPFGTVAGLVGDGWIDYVRVLHPAWRRGTDGGTEPLTWRKVAELNGRAVDLADASWSDVGGVPPHRSRLPYGVDQEPSEAEGAGALVARLVSALLPETARVWIGEWDGYGFRTPNKLATHVTLNKRGYRVSGHVRNEALHLMASVDADGWPRLVPNLVWAADGGWCVGADVDCMSTYVGASLLLPDLDALGLEWVPVAAGDRVA